MPATHRAAPHRGRLSAAGSVFMGTPGPPRGDLKPQGPGGEAVDSLGPLHAPDTARRSLALRGPLGRTPCPVRLSDLLSHQPSHVPTSKCNPPPPWGREASVGQRRPSCPLALPQGPHFPPGREQYSCFIQLPSWSPWAELGPGAAKLHGPGAPGPGLSGVIKSLQPSCHWMMAGQKHVQNTALAQGRRDLGGEREVPSQGGPEGSFKQNMTFEHSSPPPPCSLTRPLPPSLVGGSGCRQHAFLRL